MAIGRINGPMLFSNLERQGVNLAIDANLAYFDVNNRYVGISNSSPSYPLDSPGNVKLANIIILGNTITSNTGKVNLGSTSNVVISGGSANFVMYTDGLGNLNWGNISSIIGSINNITANTGNINSLSVTNFSTGNALISGGNVTLTSAYITTGQVTNFSTGNAVISGGYISSLSNITVTTGNAQSWYTTNLNSTNGNITTLVVTNFSTGNAIISGGYINNLANLSATRIQTTNFSTGNAVISGGYISALSNITATTGNVSSWYATTLNSTNGNITTLAATNFSTGNAVISGGYISALSNITATTGNVSSWYATNTNSTNGNITTLVVSNFSTANAQVTGGNVTANITGNVTGTFVNLSGAVFANTGSFTGNVTAPWFIGNLSGTNGKVTGLFTAGNLSSSNSYIASTSVQLQDIKILGNTISSTYNDIIISANKTNPNNIIRFDSVSAFDIPTGNIAQRPPNPDYGYMRFNTDSGSIEWWGGVTWVAAIQSINTQSITPDGVNDTYTLNYNTVESGILVNINGTVQQPGTAYTIANLNQITFAEIPATTDIIELRFISAGVVSAPYYGGVITGNVLIANSTISTSTSTGALVVQGGVGLSGNINIGGNIGVSATVGTPLNTTTPASWLKVYVGTSYYYMPLYQ